MKVARCEDDRRATGERGGVTLLTLLTPLRELIEICFRSVGVVDCSLRAVELELGVLLKRVVGGWTDLEGEEAALLANTSLFEAIGEESGRTVAAAVRRESLFNPLASETLLFAWKVAELDGSAADVEELWRSILDVFQI